MTDLPSFPSYHGSPLPENLSPLVPSHYLLLLTWMHFLPSRLKHYLWRADPELYPVEGREALGQSLRNPAYRGLYLTSAVLVAVLSTVFAWGLTALLAGATDWKGVMFGPLAGMALGLFFVVVGGLAFGTAFGAMLGTTFGVVFGTTFGLTFGLVEGLVGGAWGGLAGGLAFGVALGIAFIMAFGMVFGLAGGMAFIVALVVTLAGALGVALILVGGETVLLAIFVVLLVAIVAGASRLLPNLFQWFQAFLLSRSRGEPCETLQRHPVLWDEYVPWPLPGTYRLLQACLEEEFQSGLRMAARIAANPFQRWTVQRALSDYLDGQTGRLAVIYRLAYAPALGEYLTIPTRGLQFQTFPSVRQVLLGELGQQRVAGSSEGTESIESLVWRITRSGRRMEPTPCSQFCMLLHDLFRRAEEPGMVDSQQNKLAENLARAYEGIRSFRHGMEVAESFATLDVFLMGSTAEALATAHERLLWTQELVAPPLRPTVVEALKALGDVSQEVAVHTRATSTGQKSAALNRASGALNELAGYVQTEVLLPERMLLGRVVRQWQSIIAGEQGRLGEAALKDMAPAARRAAGIVDRTSAAWQRPSRPFDNPYIVGDPVYPPLLVGRKDVFDRIGEVWTAKKNPDSIILYGHRRMGKSTILRNLDQVAPKGSVVVYADMAGETSFVESTGDLLLGLADRIYNATRRAGSSTALPEPDPDAYGTPARAQFQFNRLLEAVRDLLTGGNLILALDEFEAVQRAVENQKVGKEIYQFLRAKTQEPWMALVFGGLHTLDEMSRDYQQPFYGSYENICVSYLDPKDAWRLITNPTDDFTLNYEPDAVKQIIDQTGGQPYLVQQICRDALDQLNSDLFDLELEREVCITAADVDAVLGEDFFRRGTVYFDGVWTQAGSHQQRDLLRAMAACDGPCTLAQLEAATRMEVRILLRQLQWTERHDILQRSDSDQWAFCVPLMQQWIRSRA